MNRILCKIGWKVRKIYFKFAPFYFSIEGIDVELAIARFQIGFEEYNLFAINFLFPNRTTVPKFRINAWDIVFLRPFLLRYREDLDERNLWTMGNISYIERKTLKILTRIL